MEQEYLFTYFWSQGLVSVIIGGIYLLFFVLRRFQVAQSVLSQAHRLLVLGLIVIPLMFVGNQLVTSSIQAIKYDGIDQQTSTKYKDVTDVNRVDSYAEVIPVNDVLEKSVQRDFVSWFQAILYFVTQALLVLSIGGFGVFLFRFGTQTLFISKLEKRLTKKNGLKGYELYVSDLIKTPFSRGIWRRKIYLPRAISETEETIIIHHEINHFQLNHHFWSLIESVMAYTFWYNPIIRFIRRKGALLREMECDLQSVQTTDQFEYSRILLKTAETFGNSGCFELVSQNWTKTSMLKTRVKNVLEGRLPSKRITIPLSILLLAGFLVISIFLVNYTDSSSAEDFGLNGLIAQNDRFVASGRGIALKKLPKHTIDAFIAQEDRDFFDHHGLDYSRMLGAVIADIKAGELVQGASTITQQLAKMTILTSERKMWRKLKEIKRAKQLENKLSKNQILEIYLNRCYFGSGAYGIEQAAKTYFGHSAAELTVAESAVLAQSVSLPGIYNLKISPKVVAKRQTILLDNMVELGMITPDEAKRSSERLF